MLPPALPLGRPEDALDPYAQSLAEFRLQGRERKRAYTERALVAIDGWLGEVGMATA